ncbi:MAG: preprotein translocase subunit SecG [Candidatus Nealsonbacteria bacterium RBG_13_37_56]|uniref:Protein-export membrane protein SecG n=1 Tax=Candidatus Nealsonbacteria bacterium RBG_13_37_56 TaxID=1801661 RepID=A0A1G2DW78_9BACT|nr:MAG: preprotein translocase subunit SecG [Candidatus Nealsonbacteria bacterium RBG_13_37_56]
MEKIISIIQIIIAALLITFIMLQQRGTALGSSFGGEGGGFYSTRRGLQKKILWLTIISAFLFIGLALVNLII